MVLNHAIHPPVLRLIGGIIAIALLAIAILNGAIAPARAQMDASVSVEFRTALEPHGKWQRHQRWGEVWIPGRVERGWRPYTVGQWVYTDDWGWYWTAADTEADWGWVVYHYGRWVFDDDLGWVWVPGTEWGPGWVNWRRGEEHFGWAPLPPDPVIVEYREKPDVWVFVRARDFVAPVMARVIVPVREYPVIIRRTVVVNRTVVIRDRRIAVNPGIAPAIVAARVGRPIRAFDVRPVVLAGTVRINNAVEIRAADIRQGGRDRIRVTVRETQQTIRPARDVPKPQPLAANEQGRLGDNPPRAARQERQEDRRDAREEQREDRRDAREERQEDRRDTRDDRRDQRQDDRRDTRQEQRPDQKQERRDTRQEQRQEKQERRDTRQDTRQEQRQDQRQERRDTRQERQGARDQRPGASQTEGRSPPAAREPDRAPPAARDAAPQRAPAERPRSESPAQRAPTAAERGRANPPTPAPSASPSPQVRPPAATPPPAAQRPAAPTTGAAPPQQSAPQAAPRAAPQTAPQGAQPQRGGGGGGAGGGGGGRGGDRN